MDSLPFDDRYAFVLRTAIMHAVAYADVFDFPLTVAEVQRYLVGVRAPRPFVEAVLANERLMRHQLARHRVYYALPGREHTVETRLRRAAIAARMWPRAYHYGGMIARFPFVRMVAVSGALAVDNTDEHADIDYFIVTEPGRLWLCRALVGALVHLAVRRGDELCPNYFLSERALALGDHSLFAAHELVQMVPISGLPTYRRMCRLNAWAERFLPNAYERQTAGQPVGPPVRQGAVWRPLASVAEDVLRMPVGARLERWESSRKVRKFATSGPRGEGAGTNVAGDGHLEAIFSRERCKGHFDQHGRRTREAFAERLQALDLPFPGFAEAVAAGSLVPAGGGA